MVAVKVFNDGPQYTSDSSQERLQTLQVLKQQRETLIRQEIAVLKSCRDHNIVQFVGACIQVGLLTYCFVRCRALHMQKNSVNFCTERMRYICSRGVLECFCLVRKTYTPRLFNHCMTWLGQV